ncbi:hypothetical protein ES704_01104 [subsurface metagenome]|jgi:hypothetical protein
MTKKYISRFWVSLLNFEVDISNEEQITLDNDVLIRLTTSFEDERLAELYKNVFMGSVYSNYLLEVILEKDDPEIEPGQFLDEAEEKIKKAIAIFRLFKKEIIGYNLMVQPLSEAPEYGHTTRFLSYNKLRPNGKNPEIYTLEKGEIRTFINFFNNFYKILLSKFDLAIEYFNKSYNEPYPRDSFLDLMIVLENLYLKNISQELSYRLSMRMAHILGKNKEERIHIYHLIKGAYNLRSKIVHGERSIALDKQIFIELRELTRKSIIYFLENKDNWDEKKLDELILDTKES